MRRSLTRVQFTSDIASPWVMYTSLGIFAFLALLALPGTVSAWERSVFDVFRGLPDSLEGFMVAVSFVVAPPLSMITVPIVLALFRKFDLAFLLFVLLVVGNIFVQIAKQLVDRGRPAEFYDHALLRVAESGSGFPSGHVMAATIISLVICLYFLPRRSAFIISGIFVALVAVSRMYLGEHFPLDVLGSMALGVFLVSSTMLLRSRFLAKK